MRTNVCTSCKLTRSSLRHIHATALRIPPAVMVASVALQRSRAVAVTALAAHNCASAPLHRAAGAGAATLSSTRFQQASRCMSQITTPTHPKYNGLPTSRNPHSASMDKLLFTPGPLTTSYTVKQATQRDLGSRDAEFTNVIKEVNTGLLEVADVSAEEYTTIPMQGSGTFGVEAVLCSAVHRRNGVLIVSNGSYGKRMVDICRRHHIPHFVHEIADNRSYNFGQLEKMLNNEAANVSHIAMVHSETTSGIINDLDGVGELATKYAKSYIVDAMSSFGATKINFYNSGIDYLVSSANKCIEGIPGFSFVIARRSKLERECRNNSSSLSLDLYAQREGLDSNGQFRFTPPTHSLLAFHKALAELKQEGGVSKRGERYKQNQQTLANGMKELGFDLYLHPEDQGYIISSYKYPKDSSWDFQKFYNALNDKGFVIYPGKVSKADCFRIGHIGRIFPEDTEALVKAIDEVCQQMKTAKYAK